MIREIKVREIAPLQGLQSVEKISRESRDILIIRVPDEESDYASISQLYDEIKEVFQSLELKTHFIIIPKKMEILRYQQESISKDFWNMLLNLLPWRKK